MAPLNFALRGLYSVVNKIHECESMSAVEAWIEKNGDWNLHINRVAGEDDLAEKHYLEEAGQIIETVSMSVKFCPYCGIELPTENNIFISSFTHHDF